MKTKTILSLTIMAAALAFTACSPKEDETAQLKKQIDQLEQQVQELQERSSDDPSANISTSSENLPENTAIETSSPETPSAGNTHHDEHDQQQNISNTPDITTLSARIQDLGQRIKDTTPTGSAQEQWEQFNPLEQEIESIEQDLDYLKDALEIEYQTGALDPASYREDEQTIEALEDALDQCEDQLEFKFKSF